MKIRVIPCIDNIYLKIHPKFIYIINHKEYTYLLTPCSRVLLEKLTSKTKSTQENIYCDIVGKIFNILTNSLQESPFPTPTIILIILFCSLKTLLLYEEFPQKITP